MRKKTLTEGGLPTPLEQACIEKKAEMACQLIFSGANPNLIFTTGISILTYAIAHEMNGLVLVLISKGAEIDKFNIGYLQAHQFRLEHYLKPLIIEQKHSLLSQPSLASSQPSYNVYIKLISSQIYLDPTISTAGIIPHFETCYEHHSGLYRPLLNFASYGACGLHHSEHSPLNILISRGNNVSYICYPASENLGCFEKNTVYIAGNVEPTDRYATLLHELVHFSFHYCPSLQDKLKKLNPKKVEKEVKQVTKFNAYLLQEVFVKDQYCHEDKMEEVVARIPQLLFLLGTDTSIPLFKKHLPTLFKFFNEVNTTLTNFLSSNAPGFFDEHRRKRIKIEEQTRCSIMCA